MSRKRGRPRREHRIRVRAEHRLRPDYLKIAQALLEHAAIEDAARREGEIPETTDASEREGGR